MYIEITTTKNNLLIQNEHMNGYIERRESNVHHHILQFNSFSLRFD